MASLPHIDHQEHRHQFRVLKNASAVCAEKRSDPAVLDVEEVASTRSLWSLRIREPDMVAKAVVEADETIDTGRSFPSALDPQKVRVEPTLRCVSRNDRQLIACVILI
jgi:hypothetical protein